MQTHISGARDGGLGSWRQRCGRTTKLGIVVDSCDKFSQANPTMLCNIYYMPVGSSGRVVIEIDQNLKRRLYSALALEQSTLKDWFCQSVEQFLVARGYSISEHKTKPDARSKKVSQ